MMDHAIDLLISALLFLVGAVLAVIGFIDGFFGNLMSRMGIAPDIQVVLLVVVALVVAAYALRTLGGLFALLLVALLVLLVVHMMFPGMSVPTFHSPFPPVPTTQT